MNLDLGDLILLLILLAPVLSRLFRKKQPPRPAPPADGTARPSASDDNPLAEALRQIREALEEPEPEPAPPPSPPKPLAERPRPLPSRPSEEPGFHSLGAFEHDEHGFGASNHLSEELFERRGRRGRSPRQGANADPIGQRPLKEIDLNTPLEVQQVGTSPRTDIARRLRNEGHLREAFVLKEVLDPPRSLRRRE